MKRLSLLCACAMLLSACAPRVPPTGAPFPTGQRRLIVFAPTSLTEAFLEIGRAFESRNPVVHVEFTFAGSQALTSRLEQGVPVDVVATASADGMTELLSAGLVRQDAPEVLASNRLILVLPSSNPADIYELQDIAHPGVKLVLVAPGDPAGDYARQSIAHMDAAFGGDFQIHVLANVISNADDVRQVVASVQTGEADAGIVYASDAVASPAVSTMEISPELNITALYAIAPLAAAPAPDLAVAFIEYALSAGGQQTLSRWGFLPRP